MSLARQGRIPLQTQPPIYIHKGDELRISLNLRGDREAIDETRAKIMKGHWRVANPRLLKIQQIDDGNTSAVLQTGVGTGRTSVYFETKDARFRTPIIVSSKVSSFRRGVQGVRPVSVSPTVPRGHCRTCTCFDIQ